MIHVEVDCGSILCVLRSVSDLSTGKRLTIVDLIPILTCPSMLIRMLEHLREVCLIRFEDR
jgi:hypothetical protein